MEENAAATSSYTASQVENTNANTTQYVEQSSPVTNTKNKFLLPVMIIGVFLFLALTMSVVTVLAAYEKIDLPESSLKDKAIEFVLNLPFSPKTPKFVLDKSIKAHKNVKSANIDLSLATKTDEPLNVFGINNFDLLLKGPVDFNDVNNIESELNLIIGNNVDINASYVDKKGYVKINKFPESIISTFGVNSNLVLNRWMFYDLSSPNSESRDVLNANNSADTPISSQYQKLYDFLVKDKILKRTTLTRELDNGKSIYKLHYEANNSQIKEIYDEFNKTDLNVTADYADYSPDKYLNNVTIDLYIDDNNYYLNKMIVTTNANFDMPDLTGLSEMSKLAVPAEGQGANDMVEEPTIPIKPETKKVLLDAVLTLKLAQIGEKFDIKAPENATSFDDVYKEIMTDMINKEEADGFANPDSDIVPEVDKTTSKTSTIKSSTENPQILPE